MKSNINIFICGIGNLGKLISKYAINKNCKIVGIYDSNLERIKLTEEYLKEAKKTSKLNELKELLISTKPDICILTMSYLIEQDKELYMICAELGINVITTCEEAFFSENSNIDLTKELDSIAKKNKCTIVGSGYQDIYWGQLVAILASTLNRIEVIKGRSIYNIDYCNKEVNENHGVGLEIEEYKKKIEIRDLEKNFIPSFMWNVNGWICSKLKLEAINYKQFRKPVIAEKEIYSRGLKKFIHKGQVIGTDTTVETITKEGIKLITSTVGIIFDDNDKSKSQWELLGSPSVKICLDSISAFELTASTVVNRIPDVINSKAGFITTDKLDELIYKKNSLENYLKKGIL